MFEPFLKSFFVRTSDPTHIKLLKLDILTNLVTETSISVILREFQTYISSSDKEFVGASIQAIGRCASNIKEVTDMCLNGLVSLLSNRDGKILLVYLLHYILYYIFHIKCYAFLFFHRGYCGRKCRGNKKAFANAAK